MCFLHIINRVVCVLSCNTCHVPQVVLWTLGLTDRTALYNGVHVYKVWHVTDLACLKSHSEKPERKFYWTLFRINAVINHGYGFGCVGIKSRVRMFYFDSYTFVPLKCDALGFFCKAYVDRMSLVDCSLGSQ